jgi:hypothetical protein
MELILELINSRADEYRCKSRRGEAALAISTSGKRATDNRSIDQSINHFARLLLINILARREFLNAEFLTWKSQSERTCAMLSPIGP